MTFQKFIQSHIFSKIIYIIVCLFIALLILQTGIFIGYRSASFSINRGNAQNNNLRDPRSIYAPFGWDSPHINPHGVVGEIMSVRLPVVMVRGINGDEDLILIGTSTMIRMMRNEASTSDLMVGEQIVTIGTPDDQGQIHASFIRLIPAPPFASDTPPLGAPRREGIIRQ